MTIIAIALLLSGAALGAGITLAIVQRRIIRAKAESWQSARVFYTRSAGQ